MTSIIEEARRLKKKDDVAKREQQDAASRLANSYQQEAKALKIALLAQLHDLDGKRANCGKFKLELRDDDQGGYYPCAYLTVNGNRKVAWFKVGVVSGTYDASDDCRNIPYTEACITARFYPPNPNHETCNGDWDNEERRYYHNGGWTESCSNVDKMPKFIEEMTKWISKWV